MLRRCQRIVWNECTMATLTLTTHTRAELFDESLDGDFSNELLTIGNGTVSSDTASRSYGSCYIRSAHQLLKFKLTMGKSNIHPPKKTNTFVAKINDDLMKFF